MSAGQEGRETKGPNPVMAEGAGLGVDVAVNPGMAVAWGEGDVGVGEGGVPIVGVDTGVKAAIAVTSEAVAVAVGGDKKMGVASCELVGVATGASHARPKSVTSAATVRSLTSRPCAARPNQG